MVANGNIKEYTFSTQFCEEMWLMKKHWPFVCPSVSIPPTVTEFDLGADISETLEEALEPCEEQFLDGGDSD